MAQKRMIVGGIVAVVLIGAALGIWALASGVKAVQSEAIAFATKYLEEMSDPWSAEAYVRNATDDFKALYTPEMWAQSAALGQQQFGRFKSLEVAHFEVEQSVSTKRGSERIVKLYGHADFEKLDNCAVRFKLVERDGLWLVDEFAVNLEKIKLPPP